MQNGKLYVPSEQLMFIDLMVFMLIWVVADPGQMNSM
jgi:hypothetical protein